MFLLHAMYVGSFLCITLGYTSMKKLHTYKCTLLKPKITYCVFQTFLISVLTFQGNYNNPKVKAQGVKFPKCLM